MFVVSTERKYPALDNKKPKTQKRPQPKVNVGKEDRLQTAAFQKLS